MFATLKIFVLIKYIKIISLSNVIIPDHFYFPVEGFLRKQTVPLQLRHVR